MPRDAYGKVWGLLQSGVQTGGLLAYAWYGHRLAHPEAHGALPWRAPFALAASLCALTALLCARLLRDERAAPPAPPAPAATRRAAAATRTNTAVAASAARSDKAAGSDRAAGSGNMAGSGKLLREAGAAGGGKLLRRFAAKPQFWLMLLAVGCYTPIYEYGTFVSNYLKQLEIGRDSPAGAATALHCIENQACAPRVALYQLSYIVSLLLGSVVYDRCSQLDKALMVFLLMSASVACWGTLFLAELPPYVPPPPAAALWSLLDGAPPSAAAATTISGKILAPLSRLAASAPPLPRLHLAAKTKTVLVAGAAAAIALPTSLPFAVFAMDFGKEGAAVLSSLISALGFCAQLLSLRLLPRLQRAHGWHAVFATLAGLGVVAASAMSFVMLADQHKFARGYIIRSSLLNETIVTLHACGRDSCSGFPMWAPGARREWATPELRRAALRPYAPTRHCHRCGRTQLLEVSVGEAYAGLAQLMPLNHSLTQGHRPAKEATAEAARGARSPVAPGRRRRQPESHSAVEGRRRAAAAAAAAAAEEAAVSKVWVRATRPLRKPSTGWGFADYRTAAHPVYGDRRAFERRLNASSAGNATATSDGTGTGQRSGRSAP